MQDNVARVIEKMVDLYNDMMKLGPKYEKFRDKIAEMSDEIEGIEP